MIAKSQQAMHSLTKMCEASACWGCVNSLLNLRSCFLSRSVLSFCSASTFSGKTHLRIGELRLEAAWQRNFEHVRPFSGESGAQAGAGISYRESEAQRRGILHQSCSSCYKDFWLWLWGDWHSWKKGKSIYIYKPVGRSGYGKSIVTDSKA